MTHLSDMWNTLENVRYDLFKSTSKISVSLTGSIKRQLGAWEGAEVGASDEWRMGLPDAIMNNDDDTTCSRGTQLVLCYIFCHKDRFYATMTPVDWIQLSLHHEN